MLWLTHFTLKYKEGRVATRVLITDDHSVVRQGLRMFLGSDPELEIIGEAHNGAERCDWRSSSP